MFDIRIMQHMSESFQFIHCDAFKCLFAFLMKIASYVQTQSAFNSECLKSNGKIKRMNKINKRIRMEKYVLKTLAHFNEITITGELQNMQNANVPINFC